MDNSIIKVLLVDDDDDDYLITSDLISEIKRSRYKLDWIPIYDKALEVIGQHRHDVYLVDYRLGKQSGLDLIQKAIAAGCSAPMILLTGQGDSDVDIRASEAGAMDYLVKSKLDSSILERSIRYSIQRKRAGEIQSVLFKISEAVNLSPNLEELSNTINEVLSTLVDTTNIYIALYDEDEDIYSYPFVRDEREADRLGPERLPNTFTDYVRKTGIPLYADVETQKRLNEEKQIIMSGEPSPIWLGAPLKIPKGVIGVLAVQSYTDPDIYTKDDLDLLSYVSGHIAMAFERKRAEEEIRNLAKFPSENPNPVLRVARDGTLLYANKASRFLQDYWEAAIGMILPEDIRTKIIDVFAQGRNRDDEYCCGDLAYSFTYSPSVEEGYVNIYAQNITQRKKSEQQRKTLQDQLTRAERMESLGILAGGVAHDLNNILGPLVAYPEIIMMKLPGDSPIRSEITKIEKSAQRAAEVVQDLLTMARRGRYEMTPVELNEVVNSYVQSPDFASVASKHCKVGVVVDLDEDVPMIHGSVSHLYKIIMNLVINAFEAMPEGGELKISSETRHIEKLMCGFDNIEAGQYAIMSVYDTGLGIRKEDQKHLFEPFYTKKKLGSSGSGLGLAIVYGVVKDHNGYIDVKSKLNEGTEFIVYLPVTKESAVPETDDQAVIDIRGSEKILVVDDLEEQRELASIILRSLGYKVQVASGGREAVEYLKHNQADLVILDMIMEEDFDGLQTYQAIIKIHPGQKAIIASGFSETDRVKQAEKLGVGRYIRKPYTMQILGKSIREVLDEKSQMVSA
ncbi:MAG: response regulator [candidate division Zixibacteria bacterium]|nr:response regulator [candidate division Zixibacteria bacterium]